MSTFVIDINITNKCNLACEYCYESGHFGKQTCVTQLPKIFNFIETAKQLKNFDKIRICFWGGEPTCETELVTTIIDKYRFDSQIEFLLYTNGYDITGLHSLLLSNVNIFVQVSYDGAIIQDIKRLNNSGEPTSEKVKDTLYWLRTNNIKHSVKSTITYDTFKHLYDTYMEFRSMSRKGYKYNYYPSIDYVNVVDESTRLECLKHVKLNLKKIAAVHIQDVRAGETPLSFKWFEKSKRNCSAGSGMVGIDLDGKIHACHGCFYAGSEHVLGDLDITLTELEESLIRYKKLNCLTPKCVSTCPAAFCSRCNVARYADSNKNTYKEKWIESNSDLVCDVFKEAGLIKIAIDRINEVKK